ncbi:glycosyltransferase family 4 protein [Gluconobacter thailandicus]|uniref:Glycosyltransferase family 4 protein n=1 Tax=Gluconobacter thailandicus TaxID=257438 RepID=A0AAP9JGY1_GLUTH|nr:glycosyltransferase family 4 protein [Gluconobacter thailandicus]
MPKPLVGYIDVCDRERVAGWVVDLEAADHPVRLHILMDGRLVDEIDADTFRADLAGLPREGQCAFECVWPEPLPHEGCLIEILDSLLDRPVNGSPFYIEPLPSVLSGSVDKADRLHIAGWVRDELNMERTVWLTALIDGNPTTRFPANQFRRDLREAGLGSGRYGFDYVFSAPLDPLKDHDIQLFHGQERFGSPIHIPQSHVLDDSFKRHFSTLMQSLTTDHARSDALSFLTSTADALRSESGGDIVSLKERGLKQRAARRQETAKPVAPCALFVDDRAPDPTFDAGSVALLSHIQATQALGYDCSFIASRQPPSEQDQARLAALGITCLMPPVFTGPEEALKRLGTGLDVVYLHRLNNAESYAALTRAFAPTATLVWSIADLASLRLRRQASIERRPELDRAATHIEVRENMCAWISDHVLTHSPIEAALLERVVPTADVNVVPWAVPVRPRPRQKIQKPIIAFVAHFGHAPNTDAAKWLILDIFPRLKKRIPDLVCRLIGSAMPHAVHMLAEEGVEIVGHVPNLEEVLADVSLCVAPLRYGAGIKGKVLEAWSTGLPIVMTPIAAEGLIDSDDPVWRKAVADTAEDFAQKTVALLKPTAARTQVTAARKLLRECFSDAAIQNRLEDVFPPVMDDIMPLPEDTSAPVLN